MALTRRSNLIDPQVLTDAIRSAIPGLKIFEGTQAAVVRTGMPMDFGGSRIKQGSTITVPYFELMGTELDELVNEGDALTPVPLTMSDEQSTVRHWGKAGEITHWARMIGNYGGAEGDAYAEIARQFKDMTAHTVENALIRKASEGLPAEYKHDVFNAAAPHTMEWDDIVRGKFKWGDEQDQVVLMTVHSKVAMDLQFQKDANGRPLWVDMNDGAYPKFSGIPVKISDKNPVTSVGGVSKYSSKLFRKAALAFWFNEKPRTADDSDILADTDIQAIHVYGVAHRYKRVAGGTKPGVVEILTN